MAQDIAVDTTVRLGDLEVWEIINATNVNTVKTRVHCGRTRFRQAYRA